MAAVDETVKVGDGALRVKTAIDGDVLVVMTGGPALLATRVEIEKLIDVLRRTVDPLPVR